MSDQDQIHIIGGGTVSHIRPHLALCAPAYGETAKSLEYAFESLFTEFAVTTHLTRMAGGYLETNDDISKLLDALVADPKTKMIFMPVALCDFNAEVGYFEDTMGLFAHAQWAGIKGGKQAPRLSTKDGDVWARLTPACKIINKIRKERKDIFLVGFKTTAGASQQEQYLAGLNLCKEASCNLVLANDTRTKIGMIITPEEAAYTVTSDRQKLLHELVIMSHARSRLRFTRSKVVAGDPVNWNSSLVPQNLRTVVNHCIERGAYKPFRNSTAGHFATKLDENTFLTSRRKTNFNYINRIGLVKVETDGDDNVIAHGFKPSVGGQSQRIIFGKYPEYDCIVHFHCPMKEKPANDILIREQKLIECGSHECGQNTADGLNKFGSLLAVMLDHHGPNIVFNREADPKEVIGFIENNFDLEKKSGGFNLSM